MQIANVMLALGGDQGNTIPKYGVTAAEIAVLREIHGDDAVFDIEPRGEVKRAGRDEHRRLTEIYGQLDHQGKDKGPVARLYPGAAARVHETLDELELDESFYKAVTRMTAAPAPAKGGRKAKAAPVEQPEATEAPDEIEDMPPVGNDSENADIFA